jgi:hypothetical protein
MIVALPSEASNLRIAPAKPALGAEHSFSRRQGHPLDTGLGEGRLNTMGTGLFDLSLAICQDRRLDDLNTVMMDEVEGQEGGAVG